MAVLINCSHVWLVGILRFDCEVVYEDAGGLRSPIQTHQGEACAATYKALFEEGHFKAPCKHSHQGWACLHSRTLSSTKCPRRNPHQLRLLLGEEHLNRKSPPSQNVPP